MKLTDGCSWLIQHGTVIDGSGKAGYQADVRIEDGRIIEVGFSLMPRADESVHDARGCFVAPGFIESHTHFDATMWWAPEMDPLPGYGVTTTVMGNCGFSAAPVSDDPRVREEVISVFSFFEDIPGEPFRKALPWDWRRWSEYRHSLTSRVRPAANYAAYVGHIPIRLAAMGTAAWERAATTAEIAQMAELLEDALGAGALGLSSNVMDHDAKGRPVPTLRAEDAEWTALFAVLARHPTAQFQVIIDTFIHLTAVEYVERLARLLAPFKLRAQFAGLIPTLKFQAGIAPGLRALFERFKRDGRDYWCGFAHVSLTSVVNIYNSLIFAQSDEFVWQEVVDAKTDAAKLALLRDPAWRIRARDSWDHKAHKFSPFGNPATLLLLDSENGKGPVRLSLVEHAAQLGVHPSDAMAEWLIENGLRSTVHMAPFEMLDDVVLELLKDPKTVGNISDVPAHGQMLCGAGENVTLFSDWVRARRAITVEEAVHVQTGKLARYFNFSDRGEISPGMRADVVVFALDEVERREMEKVYDVPDGRGGKLWRWTRKAAPVRLTLVNGEATFVNGQATAARPGVMLSPGRVVRGSDASSKIA
jgi:N-acyl-D-aspartate/D-glutamate deacylase